MPWLRSSANKVQTNVFCCCLIVNYGVALHRTCYTIVCRNRHGIFLGLIFGPGIFWVLLEALGIFFGSWLLAPFNHPQHMSTNPEYPPWGTITKNRFCHLRPTPPHPPPHDSANIAFYSKALYEQHAFLTWKLFIKFAVSVFKMFFWATPIYKTWSK